MKRALVLLADGFEEMEGIIIIDVLRRAGVDVMSASLKEGVVTGSRGTKHIADVTVDAVLDQSFDVIVLPGGAKGAGNLQEDSRVRRILSKHHAANLPIGAICAAPNILRNHGILKGEDEFSCHPDTLSSGEGGKFKNARIVRTRNITTSIGPGSAFEFALELVEQLCGKDTANRIAKPMHLASA
jgi:4-methyl-5(b-hydroxyethyl)-thiazole monophosphate biosynthesis